MEKRKCSSCKKEIDELRTIEAKPYCPKCYSKKWKEIDGIGQKGKDNDEDEE